MCLKRFKNSISTLVCKQDSPHLAIKHYNWGKENTAFILEMRIKEREREARNQNWKLPLAIAYRPQETTNPSHYTCKPLELYIRPCESHLSPPHSTIVLYCIPAARIALASLGASGTNVFSSGKHEAIRTKKWRGWNLCCTRTWKWGRGSYPTHKHPVAIRKKKSSKMYGTHQRRGCSMRVKKRLYSTNFLFWYRLHNVKSKCSFRRSHYCACDVRMLLRWGASLSLDKALLRRL